MRNEISIGNKLDWVTVVMYLSIMLLGWLNIFAAVYDPTSNKDLFHFTTNFGTMPLQMKQFMFMVASFLIILTILIVDMRFYETFAYVIYGVMMAMLLIVPFIGKE